MKITSIKSCKEEIEKPGIQVDTSVIIAVEEVVESVALLIEI